MKAQRSVQPKSVFERSLPIVAAALGRLCGVAVEIGGQVPSTDGKTIWMPISENMTEDDELSTLGILCHEAGHVRLTNFKSVGQKCTQLERAIDNALEDTRIEAEMGRLYPGAEGLFEKAHADKVQELVRCDKFDERTLLPLFLLVVSEEKLLCRKWLTELADKLQSRMQESFGKELTAKITSLAFEVEDAKSTVDVAAIRKRILQILKSEASKEQNLCLQKTQEAASQEARDANMPQESFQEKSRERSETALQRLLRRSHEPVVNPMDLSNAFKRVQSDECTGGLSIDVSGRIRPVARDEVLGLERLSLARKDSVSLRLALRGLVQARTRSGWRITDRGRRFSTSHLCRLVVSDARVFQARADRQAPDAAVHVLLDMSGSMGVKGGDLAVRASLGLVQGLEGIRGVNPALTVFPGAACGRAKHAVCTVLKHGERLTKVVPGQIGCIASWGGTPLLQAFQAGGWALAACRQSKKALMLITDGRVRAPAIERVIEELKKAGIYVLGIQIGDCDDLKNLPIDSAHIDSVEDLQQVLFGFAKKILL